MFLSKNIRYLRKKRGMTQEQLADVFGYDNYTTVQKWESEKSDPPVKVVDGLADLFGVAIDDLVNIDLEARPIGETISSNGYLPSDLTPREHEHMRKYRAIDENGRQMVDAVLNTAYEQITGADAHASAS